jgi:hypothetical protein
MKNLKNLTQTLLMLLVLLCNKETVTSKSTTSIHNISKHTTHSENNTFNDSLPAKKSTSNDSCLDDILMLIQMAGRTNNENNEAVEYLNKRYIPFKSSVVFPDDSNNVSIVGYYLPGGGKDSVEINDSIIRRWTINGNKNTEHETVLEPDTEIIDSIKSLIGLIPSGIFKTNSIDGYTYEIKWGRKLIVCRNCLELQNDSIKTIRQILLLRKQLFDKTPLKL